MTFVHFEVTSFQYTFYLYSIMRPYLALETDSPDRWQKFATSHPEHKPATTDTPSAKES